MTELKEYNNVQLYANEANFLEELKSLLGKDIPCLEVRQPPGAQPKEKTLEEIEEETIQACLNMVTPQGKTQLEAQYSQLKAMYGEDHQYVKDLKRSLEMDESVAREVGKKSAKFSYLNQKLQFLLQPKLQDLSNLAATDPSLEDLEKASEDYYLAILTSEYQTLLKEAYEAGVAAMGENHPSIAQVKAIFQVNQETIKLYVKQMAQAIINKQMQLPPPEGAKGELRSWMDNFGFRAQENHIVSLYLRNLSLVTLPESIGNCVFLEELNLTENKLSSLPKSFDNLTNLRHLDLEKNDIDSLPESLQLCRSLVYLKLSENPLRELPDIFTNMKALEQLTLTHTQVRELPDSIGELTALKNLQAFHSQIRELPDSIGQLTALGSFGLTGNNIKELPNSIGNLTALKDFQIASNQLVTLPESIGGLQALQSLRAQNIGLETLPMSFGKLSKLIEVFLEENRLITLPDTLEGLSSVKQLKLNSNNLKELPPTIGKMTALEELILNKNNLVNLPETIGELKSLKILEVNDNSLTTLPDTIDQLENLEILQVNECKLETLPNSICNLPKITQLQISTNRTLNKLPECIGNLKTLNFLYAGVCGFEVLPPSISELTSLQNLNLTLNKLTKLPESITKLSLVSLDLSYNQFSELPYFIWPMKSLAKLNFNENPLSDEEKEVATRDAAAILDYCRQRSSIAIMIIHAGVDADAHRIPDLIKFLEGQPEVFGILPMDDANLVSTDLVLFLATAGSINNPEPVKILNEARNQGIQIVPMKGLDVDWGSLSKVELSRELGHEYTPDDFDGFCNNIYEYVQQIKRQHNIFKAKKDIVLAALGEVEVGDPFSFTTFKAELDRIFHLPDLEKCFNMVKASIMPLRLQWRSGTFQFGMYFNTIFTVFQQFKSTQSGMNFGGKLQ